MTAPAIPPSGPIVAAAPEPAPSKLGLKGWLVLTACIGGPLAFGAFAAMNQTGASMLSWVSRAYDGLTILAVALSAVLWVIGKFSRQP